MKKNNTIHEIKQAIEESSPDSKLYFGSDSIVKKLKDGRKVINISTVVVIHKDGCHGCRVLGYTSYILDIDYNKGRPFNRMMEEVYATIDLVQHVSKSINGREFEIHLDINRNELYGSSVAVKAAIGIVQGILQIVPKVKPQAFAASTAADRFVHA